MFSSICWSDIRGSSNKSIATLQIVQRRKFLERCRVIWQRCNLDYAINGEASKTATMKVQVMFEEVVSDSNTTISHIWEHFQHRASGSQILINWKI